MKRSYPIIEMKCVCPECGCENLIDFHIECGYICPECNEFFLNDDLDIIPTTVDYVRVEYNKEEKVFNVIKGE